MSFTNLSDEIKRKIGGYKRETATIFAWEIRERLISEGKYIVYLVDSNYFLY